MTIIGIIFFSIFLVCLLINLRLTDDVLSPPNLISLLSALTFSKIFFCNCEAVVYFAFFMIQSLCVIGAIYINIKSNQYSSKSLLLYEKKLKNTPHFKLWFFSLPSILAIYLMAQKFGGYGELLEASKYKNRNFSGLGFFLLLSSSIFVINQIYLSFTIRSNELKNWVFFSLHFILFLIVAITFTSRGSLLGQIVAFALIWHFGYKKIKTWQIIGGGLALLTIASFLGVFREIYTVTSKGFSYNFENVTSLFRTEWMDFGVFPLETLIKAESIDLQLGSTYLAAITNFIPRSLWSEKLMGGGEVFTKFYTNLYDQYSDYTSGLYPEAILNFGITLGLILGSLQLFVIIIGLSHLYIKLLNIGHLSLLSDKKLINLVFYVLLYWYASGLITAEFAQSTMHFLFRSMVIIIFGIFCRITLHKTK